MRKIRFIEIIRPQIRYELKLSRMKYSLARFQRLSFMIFFTFSFFFFVIIGFLVLSDSFSFSVGFFTFMILSSVLFWVIILIPRLQANSIAVKVEQDMLQASRRFLINLQSGISIFSAYEDIAKSDLYVSRFFDEVISKIYLGMPMEKAIDESIKLSPSDSFKKIQSQIKSALLTGSNVERVFEVTLEEMIKDHIVLINEYGKKLGPVAMIYMIFGSVLPALGSVGIIILLSIVLSSVSATFFNFLYFLLGGFIILIQVIFIQIFERMRPNVNI